MTASSGDNGARRVIRALRQEAELNARIRSLLPDGYRLVHVLEACRATGFNVAEVPLLLEAFARSHPTAQPFWQALEEARGRDPERRP